jgi:hypothetical protein
VTRYTRRGEPPDVRQEGHVPLPGTTDEASQVRVNGQRALLSSNAFEALVPATPGLNQAVVRRRTQAGTCVGTSTSSRWGHHCELHVRQGGL